jgi:hypothetical protein
MLKVGLGRQVFVTVNGTNAADAGGARTANPSMAPVIRRRLRIEFICSS